MRILLVSEFIPSDDKPTFRGGVQARTYYIGKYLKKNNQVNYLSLKSGKIEATLSSIPTRILFFFEILFLSIKNKPDIIEASNVTTYIPAYFLARRLKKPAIAWIPDILEDNWNKYFSYPVAFFGKFSEKLTVNLNWDQIIAMSNVTKEKLINNGVAEEKITVIYGGVDYHTIFNLNSEKFKRPTICSVSRLLAYKKIDVLIKAVGKIKKQIPDINCKIIGEGPEEKKLEKLINNLKIQENIEIIGNITHKKTMQILKKSHIFCLPSLVEGFGIVTIEAMAAGVPYVNSDIKPTKEITHNSKGGLLFAVNDYNDLTGKIIKLLSDKKLYIQKVREGQTMAKQYDWKKISKQTLLVYKKAIQSYQNKL